MRRKQIAKMSTEKFIGCILRLKTKANANGPSKNIVGTVSDIQIDQSGQRIFLDNGLANGIILPNGFVVSSSEIADLSVISKAADVVKEEKAATPPAKLPEKDLKKPKPLKNETPKNILQETFGGGRAYTNFVTDIPNPLLRAPSDVPVGVNISSMNIADKSQPLNGFKTPKKTDTFEMTTDEIKAEEFDFEGSNSLFEKLPVTKKQEKKPLPVKNFTNKDTTYSKERTVSSIRIKENSEKSFLTDTGILVPSVDLSTRSLILNAAHSVGLTHSRMVEVMARAVAEVTLPLLGDSYRLSPERKEDRPSVLVTCGPHWQGAVGLATARIMNTLGVQTTVFCPKEEIHLCTVEERLYQLCGGVIHRQYKDVSDKAYDAVVHSLDDHLSKFMARSYKTRNFVLIDPPLTDYKCEFEKVSATGKIHVVTPALPLAYKDVKVFLVNMAIPTHIFGSHSVTYRSPFGNKLTVQLFNKIN